MYFRVLVNITGVKASAVMYVMSVHHRASAQNKNRQKARDN